MKLISHDGLFLEYSDREEDYLVDDVKVGQISHKKFVSVQFGDSLLDYRKTDYCGHWKKEITVLFITIGWGYCYEIKFDDDDTVYIEED